MDSCAEHQRPVARAEHRALSHLAEIPQMFRAPGRRSAGSSSLHPAHRFSSFQILVIHAPKSSTSYIDRPTIIVMRMR